MSSTDVDWPTVGIIVIVILLGIALTAFTSIGIEAYEQDEMKKFREENKGNLAYLGVGTFIGAAGILSAILYAVVRRKNILHVNYKPA